MGVIQIHQNNFYLNQRSYTLYCIPTAAIKPDQRQISAAFSPPLLPFIMHGSPTTGYTSRHIRGISRHTCTWQVLAVVWVATALAAGGIGWLAGARGWHASSGTFSGSSSGRLADPGRASSTPCALAAGRAVTSVPMANEQPPLLRRPAVLLFGDSLTERCFDAEGGWGAALAHRLARKADVLSRGFGGYNSRWAALALEEVLSQLADARQRVLLATLWLGANDAALPDRSA